MKSSNPLPEHLWLQRMIGNWSFDGECVMGPDEPPMKSTGSETVRAIGGFWTIGEGRLRTVGEGTGAAPDETDVDSVMTLGYDAVSRRFVGTFITGMMSNLWIYNGTFDASGKILVLDTEGPQFSGDGTIARYQDSIELVSDDHRTLTSRVLGPDGEWKTFMTAHYRRRA